MSMTHTEPQAGATADRQDLGPVAWVLDELRKTLDTATKALRRQLREAEPAAPGAGGAGLESSHLAQARDALHQCAGALTMVEQEAPARMLQAMESAVVRLIEQPASRTDEAVSRIEQAGMAVTDYLQAVLAGEPVSPVELFPQYRDVQTLAGHAQSHPADLWAAAPPASTLALPGQAAPQAAGPAARARFDQGVLKIVKTGDAAAARDLQQLCAGLAAAAALPAQQGFWNIAAGYFEALALGLVPSDLYAKRIASRVLTQYVALARGEAEPSDKLTQDLLFYCARARPDAQAQADTLAAVRAAYGMAGAQAVDYELRRFGRFDPALRAQARKRIAVASEAWSALADGDLHRLKTLLEPFAQLGESMARLQPDSAVLTQALQRAVQGAAHMGTTPAPALAMEVASAVLYLDTICEAPDQDEAVLRTRAARLAERLDHVAQGGEAQPEEAWLEQLYHRLHDRQSLGSAASALQRSLVEIEQTLDQFFRAPREKVVLGKAVALLAQMRGVLSVLGLPAAALGVARMRETVDAYMTTDLDDASLRSASFERLGSSLGALGFLVDMLGHQGTQADRLFGWDDTQGVFRLLAAQPARADAAAEQATPLDTPALASDPEAAAEPGTEPEPEPETETETETEAEAEAEAEAADADADAVPDADADADTPPPPDDLKTIGPLRLHPAQYNAFLNETDESSRELLVALGAWALEWPRPPADGALAHASALADSAAAVGFDALAHLARALGRALLRAQARGLDEAGHVRLFVDAAEDIRRLLHQFAAGFVKTPSPLVQQALDDFLAAPDGAPAAPADGSPDAPEPTIAFADPIDTDLFPVFDDEAQELLPRLSAALRQWHAQPGDQSARGEALRLLHTLKGSARLAGALRLGEQAHRLESAVDALAPGAASPSAIAPLLAGFDALQSDLASLRVAQQQDLPSIDPAPPPTGPAAGDADATHEVPAPGAAPAPGPALHPMAQQTVRVPSQLLDRLTSQTGEVLTTRARLESRLAPLREALAELDGNLDRLRRQLRDVELQAESQMQSRLAQVRDAAQDFDPLEFDRFTRMQELTRMMAESVGDVAAVRRTLQSAIDGTEDDLAAQARQARELQHDLLRTRMLAFDSVAGRLHAVVRQTARDTGRAAKLHIEGGALELDRGTLERLVPAFEHLLRNAIVHGIEDADTRAAAGKPVAGNVTVALQHEAHDLVLRVADDGRGLDLARIHAQALSLGLLARGNLLSPQEAADLIFLPGFSTARQVTALAGRGIGMDVVRAEVLALGGHVETHSASGLGTAFRIVLPQATAVAQLVLLRAGQHSFGIAANLVESVRRVPVEALAEAYRSEQFTEGGEALPFYWAGALLQSSGASRESPARHASVLVLRSAAQRLALHVDEVLGQQELVVKSPGPQLARLAGLTGLSVMASGAVVLVYNPVALASVHGAQARQAQQDQTLRSGDGSPVHQAPASAAPLVLVVDDSITVRRVVQRLLQRDGWRVALASDGQEAVDLLQHEIPAVLLSDIEMPRMDGFALARHVRADARLHALPIVMITSRMAEKHREHALAIGVDHYLGKPYAEEELLSLVRRYAVASKAV